jgi:4-amino-4-deoxy-L-arabinose transferase-like glycosyltransferase
LSPSSWWLAFGLIAGFSLNTKYMVAFQIVAMGVGVLATPLRASLTRPWLWLGAGIAGMMMLPNLLWQEAHGWPFLELGRAAGSKNLARISHTAL